MNGVFPISDERAAQIKAHPIDYSDIPEITDEFLSHCTVRFPNVSQERLEGIRALLDRTGLEKITPDNLELAKQRWKEAKGQVRRASQNAAGGSASGSLKRTLTANSWLVTGNKRHRREAHGGHAHTDGGGIY